MKLRVHIKRRFWQNTNQRAFLTWFCPFWAACSWCAWCARPRRSTRWSPRADGYPDLRCHAGLCQRSHPSQRTRFRNSSRSLSEWLCQISVVSTFFEEANELGWNFFSLAATRYHILLSCLGQTDSEVLSSSFLPPLLGYSLRVLVGKLLSEVWYKTHKLKSSVKQLPKKFLGLGEAETASGENDLRYLGIKQRKYKQNCDHRRLSRHWNICSIGGWQLSNLMTL